MSITLVQGTVETVNVTVLDVAQAIFSLDALSPTYTVVPVDPATDEDVIGSNKYTDEPSLNSSMMAQPLIDTTLGGLWARGKYRLYISFTVGDGEIPKLGPIEIFLV